MRDNPRFAGHQLNIPTLRFIKTGTEIKTAVRNRIELLGQLREASKGIIEENLLAACRPCNKARGSTEYAAWLHDPHYLRVSRNLPGTIQQANEDLVAAIRLIPRRYSERETRK
jgi:hypothetical protein